MIICRIAAYLSILLLSNVIKPSWSQNFTSIPLIQTIICESIPDISVAAVDFCIANPQEFNVLFKAEELIQGECTWQFKKEKWNCTGIQPPIFNRPNMRERKECSFIYALTSAVTVHQITSACSRGEFSFCGCDTSRNGITTPLGWQWGSCSDNISFGIEYAQNFLDVREIEIDQANVSQVENSLVHLHNNAVGRRVVSDNMELSCRCHGFSGSCSLQTCWRELPSLYTLGDVLKEKYDKAVKVDAEHPGNGAPSFIHYLDTILDEYVFPSTTQLVYLQHQLQYCSVFANFTKGRYCMPTANLTVDTSKYYPACETFCCNGEYRAEEHRVERSCDCNFYWCCEVQCQTCAENVTEFRCTG